MHGPPSVLTGTLWVIQSICNQLDRQRVKHSCDADQPSNRLVFFFALTLPWFLPVAVGDCLHQSMECCFNGTNASSWVRLSLT